MSTLSSTVQGEDIKSPKDHVAFLENYPKIMYNNSRSTAGVKSLS